MCNQSQVVATHNIFARKGNTYITKVQFFTDESETTGDPVAGKTYLLTVAGPLGKVIEVSSSDGIAVSATNEITITISSDKMSVPPGEYNYDLQETNSGVVKDRLTGTFSVEPDVN